MWYTRVIGRICLEANGEDIIAIVTGNMEMFGASLVVLEVQGCQFKLWDVLATEQSEAV